MRAFFVILLTIFFHSIVLGTPQIPDKIFYLGKEYKLQARPNYVMDSYFKKHPDKNPRNGFGTTALWRCYVATFEIRGNQLYLRDIEIMDLQNEWKSALNDIFPDQKSIKIDWFTGILILPSGGEIAPAKSYGSDPTYENYILLKIDQGIFKEEKTINYKDFEKFK